MILTIIFSIAMDTIPVQPIRVLLPRPVKTETTMKKTITIEDVKACNAMPEPIKTTLNIFCDVWYKMSLQDGKTEAEAAEIALHKLGEKILSFSTKAK
jgi:hypothetical protein